MSESGPYLSVVIPAVRASRFIVSTLAAVDGHSRKREWQVEIILTVQRAGTDGTREALSRIESKYENLEIIEVDHEPGKGWAIKHGMSKARGEYRCFIDADNGAPFEQIDGALKLIEEFDIVIGSRYMRGGEHGKRSLAKTILSRGGNLMFRLVLGLKFTDTRAPLKLYRGVAADRLFPLLRISEFGFDTELLFLAQRFGYTITEYPVRWEAGDETTVNFRTEAVRSNLELFQIRWYWWRGYYKR